MSATDLHVQPTSPAIGNGQALSTRLMVVEDFDGYHRGSRQDIGAYEVAAWISYAAGCPGTGNSVPALALAGNLGPGERVSIDVTGARARSTAALSVGLQKATIGLGGNCILLNSPAQVLFLQTDGAGNVFVPVSLPSSVVLTGIEVLAQYGIADPAAAGGIATTQGVAVRL